MPAEQWDALKKELRQDADRAIAATTDQNRKDSVRGQLTYFARLPIPASDYELNQRRSLASGFRTAWDKTANDCRIQDALFGRINRPDPRGG